MVKEIDMQYMMEPQQHDDDLHVVMFYGPTCGPCKAVMPVYEQLAEYISYKTDRIKFYRINAWEPEAQKIYCQNHWKVDGVPHFKCFFREQLVEMREGGGDLQEMSQFLIDVIDKLFKEHGVRL